MKKLGLLIVLLCITTSVSFSQILTFDFAGLTGSEATANSNTNDVNLTSSTISRGSGVSAAGNADRFNSTGWTTVASVDMNDYLEFTITPTSGSNFSITTVTMQHQRSGTGPVNFVLRTSSDGYVSNLDGVKTIPDVATTQTTTFTLSLSNIASSLTIRIYGYSAEGGAGSWGIGDGTGNDLVVNGSTIAGGPTPTLIVTPIALTDFSYIVGNGPSTAQSYVLSGTDLDGSNVTITAPTNYEISLDNSSFTSALTLTSYDGSNTTIYVRLIAGLAVNTYNGEVVVNAGGGATTVNVTCSGEVTPVLPDVVITEINDHPTFAYEYVEIFNNGLSAVDLTGWKLLQLNSNQTTTLVDNATNVFEGSLNLAPGAYAIIFRGNSTDFANFKSAYNIAITINAYTNDKLSSSSGAPQMNGSETYRLEDNLGNLIDFFGDYNGGTTPIFSVTAGDLYERREYPNNGTLSGHWYTLTASSLGGSPAEPNENPLPVELTSFSATTIGKDVKLSWNTSTEINNYGFEIERKILKQVQNDNWEKIGFVNGNGNSNSPKDYSFVDDKVAAGKYSYRLKQIDNDGQFEYSKVIEIDVNGTKKFELTQNYPNPFNPTTTIQFQLPQAGLVKLTLYNILGQEIRTLVNETKEAGTHTVNFDASELNSGVYIYKIESGSFTQTRKMTLVK